MSEWIDRFENHQAHLLLQQIVEVLEKVAKDAENHVDTLEDYNRLSQIITFLMSVLSGLDPVMVALPTLNQISKHSQAILNELTNFNSNKNRGHLVNANNHADQLIIQGKILLAPTHLSDIEGLRESIGNFRKSAGQYLRYIEDDIDKIKIKIKELSEKRQELINDISIQKGRLDNAITQFQQQFSDSAEKRREQFAEAEKERNEDFKRMITDIEERFDGISIENTSNLTKFIEATNIKIETKISEFENRLSQVDENAKTVSNNFVEMTENKIKEFRTNANELLRELSLKKEEASTLVQIIGNIGVTGNFQKIANQEKQAADWLRKVALGLMTGMVLVIGLTIFISAHNGFDWKLSLFRIGAALILAVPATYAASESSKHRIAEYRNRQAELELASIDPFLEKMPDEARNEIKAKLTERFFGRIKLEEVSSEKVTSSSIFDLLKMTIENITKNVQC